MARTHTELYRTFEGEIRRGGIRFWPLIAAGVRTSVKKKLPLLILYAPVVITTIVYSFVVYGKYAMEDVAEIGGAEGLIAVFAQRASLHIDVADKIADSMDVLRFFALLCTTWFGAGLLAEDRRLGAHLLYFSRPLSRLDYFLGKFFTVAFFAALASMAPGLFISLFAAWCSPDWEFLKQEGDVIWRSLSYSAMWIVVTSSVVLAVSSLVQRKTLALAGAFGFFILNHMLAQVLGEVKRSYLAVSLINDMQVVGNRVMDIRHHWHERVDVTTAALVLGGTVAVCWMLIAWRLRKLEVVA